MGTALVTGASGGIGLEFARIFAKNKINLILVARDENRLREIAQELSRYPIDVKYYARDLSILENAKFIYEDLKKQSVAIDYLVNNAGFGINDAYTDIPWEKELEMFNLNMITVAYFTKMFAQDMKQRQKGHIVNLGSTASFQPGPYMAGYCASKAFVLSLSEAINYELKGTGVSVTTLCPGVTDTKFHDVAQSGKTLMNKILSHATSAEVAAYGYRLMMKRKPSGVHGWANKFMVFSNRFASRSTSAFIASRFLKKMR